MDNRRIGIFDSGIGGMTLLHQAMHMLPKENYVFYADTDHVPYGTKTKEQVIAYVDEAMQFMMEQDCKAVVIACNTATAAAAEIMRQRYPIPIIGIEPAVKPAVEKSDGRRVMVVATPMTIREEKLKNLVARVDDAHLVDLQPLPGLVAFAEQGLFTSDEVKQYLQQAFAAYDISQYAQLVLGCTHFNYFKDSFLEIFPTGIQIIDGSEGTIRQLMRILEQRKELGQNTGDVSYYQSGRALTEQADLEKIKRLHERLENMQKIG